MAGPVGHWNEGIDVEKRMESMVAGNRSSPYLTHIIGAVLQMLRLTENQSACREEFAGFRMEAPNQRGQEHQGADSIMDLGGGSRRVKSSGIGGAT
jgi:hypothetical protein